ncbi:MAG: hypothetical protein IPK22_06755 [Verrucomicrobiaceae bacterium]|nr:hypothetical protein [Verrucomicrobiaceae bacterium]
MGNNIAMPSIQDIQGYATIVGTVVGLGTLGFLMNFIREQREQMKAHLEVLRERLKAVEEDRDRTEKWGKREQEKLAAENAKLQADLQMALKDSGITLESLLMGRRVEDVSAKLQHAIESLMQKAQLLESRTSTSSDPEWHLALAQGFMAQRNWLEAAQHLEVYSSLRPEDHEAHFSRGVAYANTRHGADTNLKALRAYNEAIALLDIQTDKNWKARCYVYRGAMLRRLGRLDEAEGDLLLAQKLAIADYERQDTTYNLFMLYALKERRSEMLDCLRSIRSRGHLQGIRSHLRDSLAPYANDHEFLDLLAERIGVAAISEP